MNSFSNQRLIDRLWVIPSTNRLFWVFICLALGVVLIGGPIFFASQAQLARRSVEANLETITQLKADQVIRWRKEKLADANMLLGNQSLNDNVKYWLANSDPALGERLRAWFRFWQQSNNYHDVLLVDAEGKMRLGLLPQPSPLPPEIRTYLVEAFQSRRPLLTDLYVPGAADPTVSVDVIIPLLIGSGSTSTPVGALILRHEAAEELFPLLKYWPAISASAETVLVRRDGDSVLFLSELRHRSHAAFTIRIPLTQTTTPAVQAVLGREGGVTGPDYRGVRVLANIRQIPHSTWAVLAKVDDAEALAEWRYRARLISGAIGALTLALVLLGTLVWHGQQRYQNLVESSVALQKANRAYRLLSECNQELVRATDEASLLEAICQHIVAIGGYRLAWVGIAELNADKSVRPVAQAGYEDGYLAQLDITWADTERGRGPSGTAIRTGKVVVCQDILNNPLMTPWRDQALQRGYASSVALPLCDLTGQAFGAVMIYEKEPVAFADAEIKLLTDLANDMAFGIQLQRLRTEREKATTALRESELRLQRAVAAGNVGLWEWDLETDQVYYSAEWKRQIGYADHEIAATDQEWESRVHPDDLPGTLKKMQEFIAQSVSQNYSHEFRFRHKDGSYRWILVLGSITGDTPSSHRRMLGAHVDITERKRAEEALRESETLLRESQAIAGIGSYALDIPSGLWRSSDLLDKIFGIDQSYDHSVAGWAALIHPEDRSLMLEYFQHEVQERGQMFNREYRIQRRTDQVVRWVAGIGKLEFDSQGRPIKMLGTIQDITDRKQAEERLRESNRRLDATLTELRQTQGHLVKQEQLRGLGQMASGVAHDFNNALAPIIGFSEFLLKHPEKIADQEQVVKWLTNIHTCATDAALVVRRMREFGRQHLGSSRLTLLDPNQLVLQTIELTEPCWKDQAQASGRTIRISTDLQPVPSIHAEEFAIRELLTNLIFNAVDALTTGGTLTLGTAAAGKFVCLWVRDTGIGMNAEVRQRCFEPFFTTKTGAKGSGLGLALVHSIVERHGGTVAVESEPGQGTTVTIQLPLPPEGLESTVESARVPARSQKLQVLVVDDEPALCEVVREWLSCDGHTVTTVGNGRAALRQIQANRFDLVITDKAMPELNGEQLAIEIHQQAPGLPVILMSGFGDIMKAAGEVPPQISAILSKPLTEASLREVLAKVFPSDPVVAAEKPSDASG